MGPGVSGASAKRRRGIARRPEVGGSGGGAFDRARTSVLRKMRSSPVSVFHDVTCAPWRYTSAVPLGDVSFTPGRSPGRVVSSIAEDMGSSGQVATNEVL